MQAQDMGCACEAVVPREFAGIRDHLESHCGELKQTAKRLYGAGKVREAMQHWRVTVQLLCAQGSPAEGSESSLAAAMRARCCGRAAV
jgi:hypothetical protein